LAGWSSGACDTLNAMFRHRRLREAKRHSARHGWSHGVANRALLQRAGITADFLKKLICE